ncbi:hypothetical protein SLE2022_007120 [Rubroshorea leprosula]
MEDDASSMVSNTKTKGPSETSSGTSNYVLSRPNKRGRHENGVALGRFKGVVPHNNGRWGAQIYANHQRIWLGTFSSAKEAAMAYDSAAIKLRSGDSPRNFPWTEESFNELDFQNLYTVDAILGMIRDGSYQSRFLDFLKSAERKEITSEPRSNRNFPCTLLFQKELTPSDVGKLNRLVIPKKYAVKYFTCIENEEPLVHCGGIEDVELVFYDRGMKVWKFRYCYWRSSQSFVLTRGWNKFVKEKNLRHRDVIAFYSCRSKDGQSYILIDVDRESSMNENKIVVLESSVEEDVNVELDLKLGTSLSSTMDLDNEDDKRQVKLPYNVEKKEVRLFGVQIIVD